MKNKLIDYFNQNRYSLIFISIVFIIVFIFYIKANFKFIEINKNSKIGIGKFVEYKRYPKTRDYYFDYYNNGKRTRDLIKNPPDGFHKKIGKFFEIKYSEKFNDIIVNYEKQVTDTVAILEAGFSIEDIK
ncbi:hypothetical protein [uncultured Flavobacterium sp.]|uniref:hypothetical protein n=1 Tax=uncultured Flavobacterium sp. TaxID=165435 RepID=UPI0030EDC99C|tara:strand:- start:2863 stop:3252 length:390 start_codon:yes stop_codon:yes gene_type:complete